MDFNDEEEVVSQSTPDSQIFIETNTTEEQENEEAKVGEFDSSPQDGTGDVESEENNINNNDLHQMGEVSSSQQQEEPIFSPTTEAVQQQDSPFSSTTEDAAARENTFSSTSSDTEHHQQDEILSPTLPDHIQQDIFSTTTTTATQHTDIMSLELEESRHDDVIASPNNDDAGFSSIGSEREGAISALDDRHDCLVSPTNENEEPGRDIVSPTEEQQLVSSPTKMEEQPNAITPTDEVSKGHQEEVTSLQEQNFDPFTIELSNESHAEELVVNSNGYNNNNNNDDDIEDSEQAMSFHVKQAWNDEIKEENKEQKMVVDATYTTDACSPDGKFKVGQYSSTFGDNDELSGSSSDEQESPNHHVVMSSVKPPLVGAELQANGDVKGDESATGIVGYKNEQTVGGEEEESNVYF